MKLDFDSRLAMFCLAGELPQRVRPTEKYSLMARQIAKSESSQRKHRVMPTDVDHESNGRRDGCEK